jgi:hypothetical protein
MPMGDDSNDTPAGLRFPDAAPAALDDVRLGGIPA